MRDFRGPLADIADSHADAPGMGGIAIVQASVMAAIRHAIWVIPNTGASVPDFARPPIYRCCASRRILAEVSQMNVSPGQDFVNDRQVWGR